MHWICQTVPHRLHDILKGRKNHEILEKSYESVKRKQKIAKKWCSDSVAGNANMYIGKQNIRAKVTTLTFAYNMLSYSSSSSSNLIMFS